MSGSLVTCPAGPVPVQHVYQPALELEFSFTHIVSTLPPQARYPIRSLSTLAGTGILEIVPLAGRRHKLLGMGRVLITLIPLK